MTRLGRQRVALLRSALVGHWLVWAGLLVGMLAVARLAFVVASTGGPFWQADFMAYWEAARRLTTGESIFLPYQLDGPYPAHGFGQYLYPPVLAGVVAPGALLLGGASELVGPAFALLTLALAATGLVAMAAIEGVVRSRSGALLLTGLFWASPPVLEAFITGNVELLEIGAFAWGWVAYRNGRPALLGISIALMTLIKLQPVLLLVWLFLAGNRRAISWSIATLVTVPLLLMPITGVDDWLRYPVALSNLVAGASTPVPSPIAFLSDFLPLPVARVTALLLAIAFVWFTSTRRSLAVGYGAAILAGFVLSPLVWTRYVSLEWVPLILLWHRPADRVWLAIAFVLGWGLSPIGVDVFGNQLWTAMQGANLVIFLALMLRPEHARSPVHGLQSMSR